MIKQMGFNDSQEINFLNFILFIPEIGSERVRELEKISALIPDTLGVNFEVLKLLHLCMDYHEIGFK